MTLSVEFSQQNCRADELESSHESWTEGDDETFERPNNYKNSISRFTSSSISSCSFDWWRPSISISGAEDDCLPGGVSRLRFYCSPRFVKEVANKLVLVAFFFADGKRLRRCPSEFLHLIPLLTEFFVPLSSFRRLHHIYTTLIIYIYICSNISHSPYHYLSAPYPS